MLIVQLNKVSGLAKLCWAFKNHFLWCFCASKKFDPLQLPTPQGDLSPGKDQWWSLKPQQNWRIFATGVRWLSLVVGFFSNSSTKGASEPRKDTAAGPGPMGRVGCILVQMKCFWWHDSLNSLLNFVFSVERSNLHYNFLSLWRLFSILARS